MSKRSASMGHERSAMEEFMDKKHKNKELMNKRFGTDVCDKNGSEDKSIDEKNLALARILGENIFCNKCGTQILGDYLAVNKEWGYFSDKDTQIHRFAVCEKCYDEMINTFMTPPIQEFKKEVM
jgi:ribosomal-protein-alanine N-acetyltransferase